MKIPFSFIRKIFPNQIWQQIFIFLFFLVVIPLIILGTLLIKTSQNAIQTSILQDYKQIAINASGKVTSEIEKAQSNLKITASLLPSLSNDLIRQQITIVELSLQCPIFNKISILDLNGDELATSELGSELTYLGDEEAFRKAKFGEFFMSEVFIKKNHMPVVTMALPLKELNSIKKILFAEISLRGIWETIDSIQLGNTGKAFLIDNNAHIIAHNDKKLILKGTASYDNEVVNKVLSGNAGSKIIKDAGKNPLFLVAYSPIKPFNWGLIIEQQAKEAFSFSKTMKMQSWILIILSTIAALFVSFVLSRLIRKPINKFIENTRSLASGDFNQTFRIKRRDEIGNLLFSFNQMARKLKNAKLTQDMSAVGKAATSIAHELKNSLMLVETFVNLLPSRHKNKQFLKDFFDIIPQEIEFWKRMLQNLMFFSKKNNLPRENVNLNEILEDVTAFTKLKTNQKNINYESDINKNLPFVIGNTDRLKQVFMNLLTNSIEAAETDGFIMINANLKEKYIGELDFIEVKIINTISNIAQTDISKMFEPFYTTKEDSLGLGLTISREIVKQHGGKIDINVKNNTIIFSVILPVNPKLEEVLI